MRDTNSLCFTFIMDPSATLKPAVDSSLLLIAELRARGHRVFWLELDGLILRGAEPCGLVREVERASPLVLGLAHERALNTMDGVSLRLNPPFDVDYLHATYILDGLGPQVAQFNQASAVRAANEKVVATQVSTTIPSSLTTRCATQLRRFIVRHEDVILKPLDDCAGRGIVRVRASEPGLEDLLVAALHDASGRHRFVMAQRFLPAVSEGDKRVVLAGGELIGVVNRIPPAGSYMANLSMGGRAQASGLSRSERALVDEVGAALLARGLFLVGLDLIGGKITEINVTSPSCLADINAVTGGRVEVAVVERMLAHTWRVGGGRRPAARAAM